MSNIDTAESETIYNDGKLPGIGNLYVREVSESEKRQRSNLRVFYVLSNNYHLYPQSGDE